MKKNKKSEIIPLKTLKLDLGCGSNKKDGFTGIDISPEAKPDIVLDLFSFPWPFEDKSVDEVNCSHFFEHVPAKKRPAFMDELYRVMKPGSKATFMTPDSGSNRSIQDFTHEWPPICPESYLYFNKQWREVNKLTHYGVKADFDFGYGFVLDPDVNARNQEFQQFALKHYRNHSADLVVTLTRRD